MGSGSSHSRQISWARVAGPWQEVRGHEVGAMGCDEEQPPATAVYPAAAERGCPASTQTAQAAGNAVSFLGPVSLPGAPLHSGTQPLGKGLSTALYPCV